MDVLADIDDTQNVMWLPGHALNCYAGDVRLRSWLLTPGLLTQRFRDACGAHFSVRHHPDRDNATGRWREIEMCCAGKSWVFARTRFPSATLAAEPWLAAIGDTPLGEAMAAHGGVERSDFDYAELGAHHDVVKRALTLAGLPPQSLWTRKSEFRIGAYAFHLQEVFLPDVGRET